MVMAQFSDNTSTFVNETRGHSKYFLSLKCTFLFTVHLEGMFLN